LSMSWSFDVEVETAPTADRALCAVDFPRAETKVYGDRLDVAGWAMGRRSRAAAVEAGTDARDAVRVTPALPRADVATALPGLQHAGNSGFYLVANVPQVKRAEVRVSIVLEDGEKVEGAVIRLTGRPSGEWSAADAPVVSVVIPCYNQANFLGEAIESVRRQTYPRIELIVIDDGSTDDTAAVAAELGVRCISQDNGGLAAARNRGLAECIGDYVVFLDADDRLLPHGVEANVDASAAKPEAAFVSGWCRLISSTGDPVPWLRLPGVPPKRRLYDALLARSYVIHSTGVAMFRRGPLIGAGGYRGSFPGTEDFDLYLRMARDNATYAHAGGPICEYRQHSGAMSRNHALMLEACLAALRAQRSSTWRDRSLRAARRRGVAAMRDSYREVMADELAAAVRQRNWHDAGRLARIMLRRYPLQLASSLRHARSS
jgi:glycosyltransferase involved in cell wall biosynthesis